MERKRARRQSRAMPELSDSIFIVEASQSPVYLPGLGEHGASDGSHWNFTAYGVGGVIVLKQPIEAPEDRCGALFIDSLARHLRAMRITARYVICDRSPVFEASNFKEACRELDIVLDHAPHR
jgi:hypothetical protein